MNTQEAFHRRFPTDINREIGLAENLFTGATLRWGLWRLPRVARTDPATVCNWMMYVREKDFFGVPCEIVYGVPSNGHTKATNESILTPSHSEWTEFHERLHAELQCPDFEERFGGARRIDRDEIITEYWPLCSASIIESLGFAVGESLCIMRCFLGDTDERIHEQVEHHWRDTKPRKNRVPFDRDVKMQARGGAAQDCGDG